MARGISIFSEEIDTGVVTQFTKVTGETFSVVKHSI
jgi:hypothetical protein